MNCRNSKAGDLDNWIPDRCFTNTDVFWDAGASVILFIQVFCGVKLVKVKTYL